MKEGTLAFLGRAEGALQAAADALDAGGVDFAAARAYYAAVYAAKTLLNERGLRLRTHAKLFEAAFSSLSAAGLDDRDVRDWIERALSRRGAEELDATTTCEEAETSIERARAFLEIVRRCIGVRG